MTDYFDATFSVRSISARTDSAGTPVTDMTAEEDRLSHEFVTEGWVSEPGGYLPAAGAAETMNVLIGSAGARTDYYVVPGAATGQGRYVVRLAARVSVPIDQADPVLPRKDEIYLVVEDNDYDANARSLARFGYRTGTPDVSPAAPGPDGGWNAATLLATIDIPAGAPDIESVTITDERTQSQLVVDASTLDGHAASYFSLAGHLHASDYAPIAHGADTAGHPTATPSADGFMDSTDLTKLDAVEALAQVNPSATTLRNQINAVDGGGSGLDADLLDGSQASALAASGHNHNSEHYTEAESDTQLGAKRNKVQGTFVSNAGGFAGSYVSGLLQQVPATAIERDDWGGAPTLPAPPGSGTMAINPAGAGTYLLYGQLVFQGLNDTGIRQGQIRNNAGSILGLTQKKPITGDATILHVSAVYDATGTGDYLIFWLYHTAGVGLTIGSDTFFKAIALEL